MKKWMLVALALLGVTLFGCGGVSKMEIDQSVRKCDLMVEVRTLGRDSVSWYVGNTMYLNVNQTRKPDMFPMFISTRSPSNIDVQRRIDQIQSPWELLMFLGQENGPIKHVGVVFSDLFYNEIGVDEQDVVKKLTAIFKQGNDGSMMVFYEKDGSVTDMKKIY